MIPKQSTLVCSAVVLASLVHSPICTAGPFHSKSYGYRIDVPDGWVEIPQAALREMIAALMKQNAAPRINYDAGFQLDSADQWFEYPYVLVQPLPYAKFGMNRQINEDEFPKYVRMITRMDVGNLLDEALSATARELVSIVNTDQAQLDAANRRFFWTVNMDVQGVGPIRGLAAGYFGRDSIVQVLFYSRRADWDRYADVRAAMLDSFRFDPNKAYSAQVAAANPTPPSFWSRVLQKGLVGAVAGGFLALIVGGIAALKRMKSVTTKDATEEYDR